MPDPITDDERRAIAAYAGPVMVVPFGQSGWLYPVWDGVKLVQQIGAKEARRRFGNQPWVKRRKDVTNGQK